MGDAETILDQVLLTRAQTAKVLACSVATVIRLEQAGKLKIVRLTDKRTGMVRHRRKDIVALAGKIR